MRAWNLPAHSTIKTDLPPELPAIVATVLSARGVEDLLEELEFESPFCLIDMEKAASRISEAMELLQKIAVYGDYDCDGITASYLVYSYLESMGAEAVWYIPNRSEGYGLNKTAIQKLKDEGVELIVTVDNGISAYEEAKFIKELGMELIITDHHQPGETLPDAYAVVDPHRSDCQCSFKDLAGVGVALKLVAALMDGDCDMAMEYFGEYAAIGTIGDIVPLINENRLIALRGLEALTMTDNPGLGQLMEQSGVNPEKMSSMSVAFSLVPRINAAGRIRSPEISFNLLMCKEDEEAIKLAEELCELNHKRKDLEKNIYGEIEEYLENNPHIKYDRIMVLCGQNWHHGVTGIVASRMVEKYSKPVIIISEDGEYGTGSGRSVAGFDLYAAIACCGELFVKFGGHEMAAGFTISLENIPLLIESVNNYARENYKQMPRCSYNIDAELVPADINVENAQNLKLLEPFGQGNSEPLFLMRNLLISEIQSLSGGAHIKLLLKSGSSVIRGLYFGMPREEFPYNSGDTVDILITLGLNEFQGNISASARIRDIRPSKLEQSKFFAALSFYEKIKSGEPLDNRLLQHSIPSRENFVAVYTYLKTDNPKISLDGIYCRKFFSHINYCKFLLVIDVLQERGLITVTGNRVAIIPDPPKTDLTRSKILLDLQKQLTI